MLRIRGQWLIFAIVILLTLLVLLTRFRTAQVHRESMGVLPPSRHALFVPSPFELKMFQELRELWPRRFSPKQAPTSSDLPLIYTIILRQEPRRRDEVDFFRTLAMAASLEQWNTFKEILSYRISQPEKSLHPDGLLKWARNQSCSLLSQEIAFRVGQWDERKHPALRDLFRECDPDSFFSLWLEVLIALDSADRDRRIEVSKFVQKKREILSNDSYEFFLVTQILGVLEMTIAHQGG